MNVNQGEIRAVQAASYVLTQVWRDLHDATISNTENISDLCRVIKDLVWSAKQLAQNAKCDNTAQVKE